MSIPRTYPERKSVPTRRAADSTEWQILALDSLSRLTRQFALHPDFTKLIDLVLLSMTGQFASTGAFACISSTLDASQPSLFRGTGRLHNEMVLRRVAESPEQRRYFLAHVHPQRVGDIAGDSAVPQATVELLTEAAVGALVPITVGESFLGVLGLAKRVDGKDYSDDDLSLLGTLANTISPLLSNSLLYARIESLNNWHRDVLDSVRQGVLVFEERQQLKRINRKGRRLLEKLGIRHDWDREALTLEDLFPQGVFPGWCEHIRAATSTDYSLGIDNFVVHHPDGDRVFIVRVSSTGDDGGADRDIVVTLDDITFQRDHEQRFFELEKFAEKGVMASSIAHELNNYLALILGGIELAELAVHRQQPEKVADSLEKLKHHAHTMERFTAGLTDYSRMESEKGEANLAKIVMDVTGFAKLQKRFNNIQLDVSVQPELPSITVDTDQIAQLIMNLLNNAADAIRDAGRDEGLISVRAESHGEIVILQVSDNGVGVPEDLKDKLFSSQFTTKKDGHGFGLVTCGRILKSHDASHTVETMPGESTTIRISFPVS